MYVCGWPEMVTLLSSTRTLTLSFLADSESRGFGVVAFHLAAVRSQHDDALSGLAIATPLQNAHIVAEPAAGELHAGGQAEFRVAGEALVVLAVVEEFFRRHVAVEDGEGGMRRHTMAGLVEQTGTIFAPPAMKPR